MKLNGWIHIATLDWDTQERESKRELPGGLVTAGDGIGISATRSALCWVDVRCARTVPEYIYACMYNYKLELNIYINK